MGAPDLLHTLRNQGFRLWTEGGRLLVAPKERLTDETRTLILAHRAELLAVLAPDQLPDPQTEARRRRVLTMLTERPGARYALVTDTEADAEAVILALGIRGAMRDSSIVTCELRVPREKYDPFLLLDLVDRHGGTQH